jgi:hypothetical protein
MMGVTNLEIPGILFMDATIHGITVGHTVIVSVVFGSARILGHTNDFDPDTGHTYPHFANVESGTGCLVKLDLAVHRFSPVFLTMDTV